MLLALIVVTSAFTAIATTTYRPTQKIGPYFGSSNAYSAATGGQAGGYVEIYKDTVDTLIVGDVVYIVGKGNVVTKNATLANYNTVAGVVVGGTRTNMQGVTSAPAATDTAAYANQNVLVLRYGRTWVRVDTTTAGIPAGALIIPSLVAGKVKAKSTAIDSAYRVIGRMLDTGIASTQVLALINVK